MRRPIPTLACLASDPARIGAYVKITPRGDDSGRVLTGVITNQPTTGQMVILLNDGRAFMGLVRPHTQGKYRLLIENTIVTIPIEDVKLIRILD